MKNKEFVLPKDFFKKRHLEVSDAAILMDSFAELDEGSLSKKLTDEALKSLPPERIIEYNREKEIIDSIKTGDEVISYMRHPHEFPARYEFAVKALSIIDGDIASKIVARYKTTLQDNFIELAFYIFANVDEEYIEMLFREYDNIRSPYARAIVCLLLGRNGFYEYTEFLYKEYYKMQEEYPDEEYCEFPLLALEYLYCG